MVSRILITGAAGFIGRRLTERLAQVAPAGSVFLLWDHLDFEAPALLGHKTEAVSGDLCDPGLREHAFAQPLDAVFHLAAVVSAQAEADFDLGMTVNVDGTRALLEACRAQCGAPKFLMASSVAVFGGAMPERVPDSWAARPRSSYGAEKAICEVLVNEYSRRGFVDGTVLRLPTVVVRPGRPNKAASSFASSIIREPLAGERALCPVDGETPMWLTSPAAAVEAFVHAYGLSADDLGDERIISLPGISVTVADMVAALERAAGAEVAGLIDWQFDAEIAAIVQSWPGDFEAGRALQLGFAADDSFDDIIAAYRAETE